MDWSDPRPLAEIPLAYDEPIETRVAVADRVRAVLANCGIETADDIAMLGCTGLAAYNVSIEDSRFVRLGLAGSGVGLTCFIPPERFCLVHGVIGGLQEAQLPRHEAMIRSISRELTADEKAQYALVETARQLDGAGKVDRIRKTRDVLTGRKVSDEIVEDLTAALDGTTEDIAERTSYPDHHDHHAGLPLATAFTCPEHSRIDWACRYCVAAEVARGPLEPMLSMVRIQADESGSESSVAPGAVETEVQAFDDQGGARIRLLVQCASWRRRLAREE